MSSAHRRGHDQSGLAALGITLTLLLVISLMTLYTNRALWLEQRTAANQYRGKQALEVAEAGIERMISLLNTAASRTQYLPIDSSTGLHKITTTPSALPFKGFTANNQAFIVQINYIDSGESSTGTRKFELRSTGGSDCSDRNDISTCTAQAVASVKIRITGPIVNGPISGLVVNGPVYLGGGPCISNPTPRPGGTAIMTYGSGGTIDSGGTGGCTGGNFTSLGSGSSLTSGSGSCDSTNSCTQAIPGGDLFLNIFGQSKAEVQANATSGLPSTGSVGGIYWIDNPGNLNDPTYGSPGAPTILILNGTDVRIGGSNWNFYGVIYVTGSLCGAGGGNVYGAIVVEGSPGEQCSPGNSTARTNGGVLIQWDPSVITALEGTSPPVTKIMGSWKDW